MTGGNPSDLEKAIDSITREILINRNSEMLLYSAQLFEIKGLFSDSAAMYTRFVDSVIDEMRMERVLTERRHGDQQKVIKSSEDSIRKRQVQDALLKISLYNPPMFIDLRNRVSLNNTSDPDILELVQ